MRAESHCFRALAEKYIKTSAGFARCWGPTIGANYLEVVVIVPSSRHRTLGPKLKQCLGGTAIQKPITTSEAAAECGIADHFFPRIGAYAGATGGLRDAYAKQNRRSVD